MKEKIKEYFKVLREIAHHVAVLETLREEKEDNLLDKYLELSNVLFWNYIWDIIYEYVMQTAIKEEFIYSFDYIEWWKLEELSKIMKVNYEDGRFIVKMTYTDSIIVDDLTFIDFLMIVRPS